MIKYIDYKRQYVTLVGGIMKSIKTKLLISFIILILVSSAALGFTTLRNSSSAIKKEAEKALKTIVSESVKVTESRMETQIRILETIAFRPEIQSMNWNVQRLVLKSQLESTGFLDVAVVQPDGTAKYTDGSSSELGDREYVKKALNGTANISDLLISKVTNEPVIMFAVPIIKNGNVLGVLIGRKDGNALSSITNDTKYGENGYAYIINGLGNVVAHPDKEKVLTQYNPIEAAKSDKSATSVGKLFEKILTEKTGISSYNFNGKDLYASYEPISGTDWTLVITANEKEVLSAIPALQMTIIIVSVLILAISILATYIIGNSITKPIIQVVNQSKYIAELDITQNMPVQFIKKKDEIGILSNALQNIITNLRNIISEVNDSSVKVTATAEELSTTSQQSATASEEVTMSVGEIATGASEQARNTEEGAEKANLLGVAIEKDQKYLKTLNSATAKVGEVLNNGLKEIDYLSIKTEDSNKASGEIYDVIMKTNESANKIGQASNVIASIAGQTNLLALNAAIEAARAGEAGKGFAVVADEIKKLAEQSTTSTMEIDEVVQELQINSKNAVKTIEIMTGVIKEQTQSVIKNKDNYLAIADAIKNAEKAVAQLNASGDEMDKMKNEILNTFQSLSAIAEENSAATQQVTASMEEQTASMEEIAGASENLELLAQNLQTIIKKFKV